MSERMEALAELTQALPDFPLMTYEAPGYKEYKMKGNGICRAWDVLTVPGIVSITDWFAQGGDQFPTHEHNEQEWIIAESGEMTIYYEDGEEFHLTPGKQVFHQPGRSHWATFITDCRFRTVMIPSADYYPSPGE